MPAEENRVRRLWQVLRKAVQWADRCLLAATPGGLFYDAEYKDRVRGMIRELGPSAVILDLGSGQRHWGPRVIRLDIELYSSVQVVADGERLPFRDDSLDGVICTAVLEHVRDSHSVTAEIWRVIRPGGMVYVSVPFIQGYHPTAGTCHDYRRMTQCGLDVLMSLFDRTASGVSGGPSSSLAGILREYLALLFFNRGRAYNVAYMLAGWLTWWIPFLDRFLAKREKAHRIASAFYFLGRKPLIAGQCER